jgi:hypothetical protein
MRWLRLAKERPPKDLQQPNPRGKLGRSGWVIVQETITGSPFRWFCYHNNDVWRWSGNPARAEVFPTKQAAIEAVANCSVQYRSVYQIRNLET